MSADKSVHRVKKLYSVMLAGSRPKKYLIRKAVADWCDENLTPQHGFYFSKTYGYVMLRGTATDLMLFAIRFP